jgi:methylmalonyl-CoA/ethylmalonyl-CoA epimerase
MQKIDHIGIAVKNLTNSIPIFEKLLKCHCYKTELVKTEGVTTAFFQMGETKVELLESFEPDSVISKFIAARGEGIHHVALAVEDIHEEMKRLEKAGFILLNQEPRAGADNKLICFLHPKTTGGVLIELCMERPAGP